MIASLAALQQRKIKPLAEKGEFVEFPNWSFV
jgi:hypothetical protein